MSDRKSEPFTEAAPGHWETQEGVDIANSYRAVSRAGLCGGEMSDFAVANLIYMADRSALDLVARQTTAKERIRWLSVQLADAKRQLEAKERRIAELLEANNRYVQRYRLLKGAADVDEVEAVEIWRAIMALTADEGASVRIVARNPDPLFEADDCLIDCVGPWTDWAEVYFGGRSYLASTKAALERMGDGNGNPPQD